MSDSFNKLIESLNENTKVNALMMRMLPKIHKKYAAEPVPVLLNLFNALCIENIPHIDFMTKYWESIGDYRYKRSLPEWNEIGKYANETSAKLARNKYYGIDQSSGRSSKKTMS